jgi:hypothetical protein
MDRIKMAYISNNKWQFFLKFVCVDNRSALTLTLLQMHTSLCTESATYNLYAQTRGGRLRTSMEQSETKIGQNTLKTERKWWTFSSMTLTDTNNWCFKTGCTGLANVSLAVAMLLMLSSVIMSHFMKKYKYPYPHPQPNFHTVDP